MKFVIAAVVVLAVAMGVQSSYISGLGLGLGNSYGYGVSGYGLGLNSGYGLGVSKIGYSGLGVAVGVPGQSLSQGPAVYGAGLYSAAVPAAVNVVSSPAYSYAAAPAAVNYASYAAAPAAVNVVSSPSYYAAAPTALNYGSYAAVAAPAAVNIAASPVYAAAKIPAAVAVIPQAAVVAGHGATYVAKNRGAIHTAPLAGHVKSAASINVAPAPGTW